MNAFEANAAKIEATSAYLAAYIRPDRQFLKASYFTYNLAPQSIAANSSAQAVLQTLSDSDFVLETMTAYDADVQQGLFLQPFMVQITDLTAKKTFYSAPTPAALVLGGVQGPYVLPVPRLLAPLTTLRFDMTNTSAHTWPFNLTLGGWRIFYGGPN